MNRRLRMTDAGECQISSTSGQHMHCNWICLKCLKVASEYGKRHYPDCDNNEEVYAIPAHAECPRKKASKRQWDVFLKTYVYAKPVGWWFYEQYCWWYKHKKENTL